VRPIGFVAKDRVEQRARGLERRRVLEERDDVEGNGPVGGRDSRDAGEVEHDPDVLGRLREADDVAVGGRLAVSRWSAPIARNVSATSPAWTPGATVVDGAVKRLERRPGRPRCAGGSRAPRGGTRTSRAASAGLDLAPCRPLQAVGDERVLDLGQLASSSAADS
jgi:hypothetical protein